MTGTAPQGRSGASWGMGVWGRAGASWAHGKDPCGIRSGQVVPRKGEATQAPQCPTCSGRLMPALVANSSQGYMSPSGLPEALNLSKKWSETSPLAASPPFPRCSGTSEADTSDCRAKSQQLLRAPRPHPTLHGPSSRLQAGSSEGGTCAPLERCSKDGSRRCVWSPQPFI